MFYPNRYVMYKQKSTADEAMAFVKSKRSWINPNPGFLRQLELFEELGHQVDEENDKFKLYKQQVEEHRGAYCG